MPRLSYFLNDGPLVKRQGNEPADPECPQLRNFAA